MKTAWLKLLNQIKDVAKNIEGNLDMACVLFQG